MARCTAPVNGHRTASARANCPACSSRGSYRSYSSYPSSSYSSYGGSSNSSSGSSSSRPRPSWSSPGSSVVYTPAEIRTLTPVRKNVEKRASKPDLRDVSPLLGSRSGLDTAEDPIGNVASKLAELVAL